MNTIQGLYFFKDYFPTSCTKELPCCLASGIYIRTHELSNINRTRIPCQRCMLLEFNSQYIDEQGIITDKFKNYDIRGTMMNRRVIHYGYNYNYTSKHITRDHCFSFDESPTLSNLRILFNANVNQALINEYTSGQNIGKHIDSPIFGPMIYTISLGSSITYYMDKGNTDTTVKFIVNPGDLIILTGDARYIWRHGTGTNSAKDFRRVSITLRYADEKYIK